MEAQLQRLADAAPRLAGPRRLRLRKLRGDTARDFVRASLATQAFPTILAFPAAGGGRAFVKHASEERSAEALLAFVNGACATARSLSAQQAGEGSWEL